MTQSMDYEHAKFEEQNYLLQIQLLKWQNYVKETNTSHIILVEGRDAAGKSGAIKCFMENLNPRASRLVALPKPTEEDLNAWFWQRYVNELPRRGEICFFDRSYYNRALVEPVMGFCSRQQTDDFYREAPQLEKIWVKSGIQIIKFYFSITREEQARRFFERQTNPLKLGKLSEVDRASQSLWDEYTRAKNRMFALTNLKTCPWIIVDGNNKKQARLNAMRYILLKNDFPGRDLDLIGKIDYSVIKFPKV